MDHKLRLYHVGPIQECDLDLNDFTVLTGPQSSGKSTVAKAVYFFRTVKQDILNIIMQGGPQAVSDRDDASWSMVLEQRHLKLLVSDWDRVECVTRLPDMRKAPVRSGDVAGYQIYRLNGEVAAVYPLYMEASVDEWKFSSCVQMVLEFFAKKR